MKCNHCGAEFEGNYCPECGVRVEMQTPAVPRVRANTAADKKPQQPQDAQKPQKPPEPKRTQYLQKPQKPFYKKWSFYVIIAAVAAVVIGAIFVSGRSARIDWDEMVLGTQLPQPPADKGEVRTNSLDELSVAIKNLSDKQYADYVDACKENGFTVDAEFNSSTYSAYNSEGYKLALSHYGGKSDLCIQLKKPIEMSAITWPESAAGSQLPAPKSTIGKFTFEHEDNFCVYIGSTSKEDYNAYVKACSDKGFTVNYSKGDNYYTADNGEGWHVSLKYEGNQIMSIDLDAPPKDNSAASSPAPDNAKSSETAQSSQAACTRIPDPCSKAG